MTLLKSPIEYASEETILAAINACDKSQGRVIVGIAGPPGSGKSTFASKLAARLGPHATVLPMDGFHLDNDTLSAMDLLDRKGAPQTFDGLGFVKLVRSLRLQADVSYPTFDRAQDKTIPNGGQVHSATRIVLIEGNYLLLQRPPWSELKADFDLTVYLDVSREVLRSRLVARWCAHGLTQSQAQARAEQNDMKNVETVCSASARADFFVASDDVA